MENSKLNVRSFGWLANNLSWAYVVQSLINAFDEMGHNAYAVSTNGLDDNNFYKKDKMKSSILALQHFGAGKRQIDIDFCYTIPLNMPQRFLSNSKHKCLIYNYETQYWAKEWYKYYDLADFYFPSSNFSAEIFHMNGVPIEKTFVIPHGVDTTIFNSNIPKIKLKTQKKFKFCSIVAPHYRKNIDLLLNAYCEAFTSKDDVCLVLKTKIFKHSDGNWDPTKNPAGRKAFEIVLGDLFKDLSKKFGKNIPEIEILGGHVDNVASIYNACDCNVTCTGAEGFYMPGLESQSCGLINIAPRYSGQLDFMNDNNSLLIDTTIRKAKPLEQYWAYDPRSTIGQADKRHTIELMHKAKNEHKALLAKFQPEMKRMVEKLSWTNAAQMIIDATEKKLPPYIPGTYKIKL